MKNKVVRAISVLIMLISFQSILFLTCKPAFSVANHHNLTEIQQYISNLKERYNWHSGKLDGLKKALEYEREENQTFSNRYRQFMATPEGQIINSLLERTNNNQLSETERNNMQRQQWRHSYLRGNPYPFEYEIWAENPSKELKDAWKEYQVVAEWYTASARRLSRYEEAFRDAECQMNTEINSLVSDLRNTLQILKQTGADRVLIKQFEVEIAMILGQKTHASEEDFFKPWEKDFSLNPVKGQEKQKRETKDEHSRANVSLSIENVKKVADSKEYKKWTFDRIFKEKNGVGVTFTEKTLRIQSADMRRKPIIKKGGVNIRLEAGETYVDTSGSLWFSGKMDMHLNGNMHMEFKGVDDNGNEVVVKATFSTY